MTEGPPIYIALHRVKGWGSVRDVITRRTPRRFTRLPIAPNAFVYVTPDNVAASQVRSTPSGSTSMTSAIWYAPAYWVRLVRTGNRITSFASPDGVSWTQMSTYDLPLTTTVLVGFAVTSHEQSQLTTAVFNDPSIR